LDEYLSEDEQAEAIRKWWKENGRSIMLGLVLGLGVIFGWRGWQSYTTDQAEQASALYEKLVAADHGGNAHDVTQLAGQITGAYASTPYAILARLVLAKQAVVARDMDEAEAQLRAALQAAAGKGLSNEIRLRLARVLAAREKYPEARAVLDAAKDPGGYAANYDELRGDMLAMQGDAAGARAAYKQALSLIHASGRNAALIEVKLDDLGRDGES
jgi:predicted negative regulator of RcsB-dependent stress response